MKLLIVILTYGLICFVVSFLFGMYVSKALQPLLVFPAMFFGLIIGLSLENE